MVSEEGVGAEAPLRFALRGGGAVTLHATGFRHPRPFGLRERFTPYADLVHVFPGLGGLRLATRRTSSWLTRRRFSEPREMALLASLLRERVASLPGGAERIAQMARLDLRVASARRPWVAPALTVACVVAFVLQVIFFPRFEHAGAFSGELVRAGELWRLVTANFLHAGASHLLLNAIGLLVLGGLLESIIGSRAVAFVLATASLGAMGASLLADYLQALGASGLVTGIVGALVWLELRRPDAIPAPWRIPRALLLGAVAADAILLSFVPAVAHAAHAGGFVVGGAAAACLFARGCDAPAARAWLGPANVIAACLVALALAGLWWSAFSPDDTATRRRAERLLVLEGVRPEVLNNEAWMIAISGHSDPALLEVALRLAEEAVARTARRDPNLLDTLAEVHFAAGRTEAALATIDEAIVLAPEADYLREQRRRFTGQRAPDDRPEPPNEPMLPRPGPRLLPAPDDPSSEGIRV
jgi:membrane associated rhomboid family serine protease